MHRDAKKGFSASKVGWFHITVIPNNDLLFTGGLFSHLGRTAGVPESEMRRLRMAAILVLPLLAWLPLLALSAADGKLLPGTAATPFLLDLSGHIRLLIALPLLLIAGRVAAARMLPTLQQFLTRRLIEGRSEATFNAAVASAFRLGDSVVADLLIIALIYSLDTFVVYRAYHVVNIATWYASPSATGTALTKAGAYYAYVSLPLFEFILFRWYFRLFIWARFLAQVARSDLRLVPTNPDRVGGLGFLLSGMQALTILAVAHGALLAGLLTTRVLIRGNPLTDFKGETIAVVVFVLCITLLPLLFFTPALIRTKRKGILEYGALATRYVIQFDNKWIRGPTYPEEALVGSADVQSLADMGSSYGVVQSMRNVPITPQMLLGFTAVTLVPVAPLLLTLMPVSEIINKLVGILF